VCAQVGNVYEQSQQWNRPEDIKATQFMGQIPLSESPSDLSGQIVAGLVSGALALQEYNVISGGNAFEFVRLPRFTARHCLRGLGSPVRRTHQT
jgi:hypothetical protein